MIYRTMGLRGSYNRFSRTIIIRHRVIASDDRTMSENRGIRAIKKNMFYFITNTCDGQTMSTIVQWPRTMLTFDRMICRKAILLPAMANMKAIAALL